MADDLLTRFKLTDQTSIGTPTSSIRETIASDKSAMKWNDPLYSWYMQALPTVSDPSTKKIYDTVVGVVNRNRYTHQRTKDLSADIVSRIESLYANETSPAKKPLHEKIQSMLGMSPLDTKVTTTPAPTGVAQGGPSKDASGGASKGGGNRFLDYVKKWRKAPDNNVPVVKNPDIATTTAEPSPSKEALRLQFEKDPIVAEDNTNLTSTDRVIFIAMTFVLRGITLFLVEWAVNTYMVKTFEDAFKLYLVTYLAIFAVWAIMVNASDSLFFRMLFYYVDTQSHGMMRIIVHFLIQMVLLPIPYIVRTKGFEYTQEEYTYEKRRKTMSILNNFTFFIWAITSVIALRY